MRKIIKIKIISRKTGKAVLSSYITVPNGVNAEQVKKHVEENKFDFLDGILAIEVVKEKAIKHVAS